MPNGHPLSRTPRFAIQNVSHTAKLQQTIILPHSGATQVVFGVLALAPCKNVALASVGRTILGATPDGGGHPLTEVATL